MIQSKGSDQRNSGPEKKSDTETRTTSSNSKKEDYMKSRHKSPEKSKNIDKRSDRSSHHKKSSTDSARSEKSHRDHHRHRWFIFAFIGKRCVSYIIAMSVSTAKRHAPYIIAMCLALVFQRRATRAIHNLHEYSF